MLGVYTEIQTVEGDMATVNPEALDALNALLEDQRASVEIDVALAMGATELAERDTFTTMGHEDVLACVTLREHLEQADAPVTRRINGVVLAVLDTETYDDRLRAFVDLHTEICDRVSELLPQTSDREMEAFLREMYDQHQRNAEWCVERAEAFARTRTLDFRAPHRPQAGDEQSEADPQWEPLDPLSTPETGREADPPQPPRATSSYPEWYGDAAADDQHGETSRDMWQDDDLRNRQSRFLHSHEVRVDGS
ncbi:MAG: DUF6306 domain-containing protein, partial [Ktedonobacterales bacterium]